MAEEKIVTKGDMANIVDASITVVGAAVGLWANQTWLQNKGAWAAGIGAGAAIGGAFIIRHKHGVVGGAVLGAGLANLFVGVYDMATGNSNPIGI